MILPQPSKIVCVGQNYAEHVRELNGTMPSEPVLFQKAPSSWADPFAPLELPPGAEKLDYEVELRSIGDAISVYFKPSGLIRIPLLGGAASS